MAMKTWGRDTVLTRLQSLDWRFSTTFSGMACLEHAAISAAGLHQSRILRFGATIIVLRAILPTEAP